MKVKYDMENLITENFPFKITDIKREFPNVMIKIDDIPIIFRNYEEYNKFGYLLKRQIDLNTMKQKNGNITEIDELKYYVIFDSAFNVIGNFMYEEKFEKKHFLYFLGYYSEKCFWGTVLTDTTLSVDVGERKPQIKEYFSVPNEQFNTKVLIDSNNKEYDETFFVYIDNNHKPDKFLDVAYMFINDNGTLLYDRAYKNSYIY